MVVCPADKSSVVFQGKFPVKAQQKQAKHCIIPIVPQLREGIVI
jgi:hypothetical protein